MRTIASAAILLLGFATQAMGAAAGPCDNLPADTNSSVYVSSWIDAQTELSKAARQIAALSQCVREQQVLLEKTLEAVKQQDQIIREVVLDAKTTKR